MPTHWLIASASCCRWDKVSLPKARSSLASRASKTKGKNGFLYARNQSPAQMQRMPAFPDSTARARARFQDSAGRMLLSGPQGTCKPAGLAGLGGRCSAMERDLGRICLWGRRGAEGDGRSSAEFTGRHFAGWGRHSGGFLHPHASWLSPRTGEREGSSAFQSPSARGCGGRRGGGYTDDPFLKTQGWCPR